MFSFGENDLYQQADNPRGSYVRMFQEKFKGIMGFSPPLFYGRGIFNYSFGIIPYRKPVNTVGKSSFRQLYWGHCLLMLPSVWVWVGVLRPVGIWRSSSGQEHTWRTTRKGYLGSKFSILGVYRILESGRVQSWEQYGVKILEIFWVVPEKTAFCYFSDVIFWTCGATFKACLWR